MSLVVIRKRGAKRVQENRQEGVIKVLFIVVDLAGRPPDAVEETVRAEGDGVGVPAGDGGDPRARDGVDAVERAGDLPRDGGDRVGVAAQVRGLEHGGGERVGRPHAVQRHRDGVHRVAADVARLRARARGAVAVRRAVGAAPAPVAVRAAVRLALRARERVHGRDGAREGVAERAEHRAHGRRAAQRAVQRAHADVREQAAALGGLRALVRRAALRGGRRLRRGAVRVEAHGDGRVAHHGAVPRRLRVAGGRRRARTAHVRGERARDVAAEAHRVPHARLEPERRVVAAVPPREQAVHHVVRVQHAAARQQAVRDAQALRRVVRPLPRRQPKRARAPRPHPRQRPRPVHHRLKLHARPDRVPNRHPVQRPQRPRLRRARRTHLAPRQRTRPPQVRVPPRKQARPQALAPARPAAPQQVQQPRPHAPARPRVPLRPHQRQRRPRAQYPRSCFPFSLPFHRLIPPPFHL